MSKRPRRYPVKISLKVTGEGLTNPREGDHFVAENSPFKMGVAEGQLKYWVVNGKIVKTKILVLNVKKTDFKVEAVLGLPKKHDLNLDRVGDLVQKDISATTGIKVKHDEATKGKTERRTRKET